MNHLPTVITLWALLGSTSWAQSIESAAAINFAAEIRPLLEQHCLACHSRSEPEGGLDLSTAEAARRGGDSGPSLVPYRPQESPLYTSTIADADSDELMPPASSNGPLPIAAREKLRRWIEQGAEWPADIVLVAQPKPPARIAGQGSPDNLELIKRLHAMISERAGNSTTEHSDYEEVIPASGVEFQMVAIPGGDFLMGSPPGEAGRADNEGPQVPVKIATFWMGKYEVTWNEYEPFMTTKAERLKDGTRKDYDPTIHGVVDAVSCPTPPYMEMSFGMGQDGFPAISMTQHAANKYCQWLSAQTGHFYRLPTEAEWEYACRAGTTTAYSFGDDPALLEEYAWFYDNSNEKYQKVGQKKPNPWGLYDMHGNVLEWTADQFKDDYFQQIQLSAANPFVRPTSIYPRSVRGGSWDDDPEQLRSAFRRGSEKDWKQQDPQLPKSLWYHTDAQWLGFRILRPLNIPTAEEMDAFWNSATKKK